MMLIQIHFISKAMYVSDIVLGDRLGFLGGGYDFHVFSMTELYCCDDSSLCFHRDPRYCFYFSSIWFAIKGDMQA